MNAFASSRLARGEGRIGVIAPLQPTTQTKAATKAARGAASSGSRNSQAAATAGAGHKRKRAATSDALFAEEDDGDDDDDEEEEEEEAVAPRSAKSASRPPPPQPKQRSHRRERAVEEEDEEDGQDDGDDAGDVAAASSSGPSKKRRTAPEELSSKKAVSAGVIVTALPKFNIDKKRRDPRFDPMCGDFDPLHFHNHYSWMAQEKQAEIAAWQAELRSGKSSASGGKGPRLTDEEREEIRARIQQSQQHLAALKREQSESTIVQKWKSGERKAQKETGKGAFYLKKSEVKKLQLAARYLDLKEKGGLQKFMVKRTKEVANRDHKYMPREGREG